MRTLIVEDDTKLAENTAILLRKGLLLSVDTAASGAEGLTKFRDNEYDLVILDWMLGDMEGVDLCKEIRKLNGQVPILMLTARSSINDKLRGFDNGADDYLTKPFLFAELAARIKAVLRRKYVPGNAQSIEVLDLVINLDKHEALRDGQKLELTPKEFALLEYLAINKDKAMTREEIMEHVWDENVDMFTNTVDVHIRYLRSKLDDGREVKLIKTIKGKGYMLCSQ